MRLKKGFTLAEILIVLMVIGVIATMTIPSMMKGVAESQFKTGFKKAYNTIANLTAMERISGTLPVYAEDADVYKMYLSMLSSLSVKEYAAAPAKSAGSASGLADHFKYYNDGKILTAGDYKNGISIKEGNGSTTTKFGSTSNTLAATAIKKAQANIWIVTDDNIAYSVVSGGTGTTRCGDKLEINAQSTSKNAYSKSCVVVVADVNGLSKGPNVLETQVADGTTKSQAMTTLTGDRYIIFVGSDGAAAGPKEYTVSGRIMGDVK